jgi:hypothetical protein
MFSATSSSRARRTVPWLTPKSFDSSCSVGMIWPDFHSLASSFWTTSFLICSYSG